MKHFFKLCIPRFVKFQIPTGVYEIVGFEKQTNDLRELKIVTDVVTMKTSSKTNPISKSDGELFLNIQLGLSATWDFFPIQINLG